MKILVICQYYYPEPFRVSDLCEEMAKRGHSVTVVTGTPNYPMGKIYDGYRGGEKQDEIVNGVSVHRCPLVARRSGIVYRLLNYFSFIFSSNSYVGKLKDDFDVVYVNQLSPVMMASAGIKYKKKHHKKLVLYCLDLWPESLLAGGIKKSSVVYKVFHKISEFIYRQADALLITSKSFADYFSAEFGIANTTYLPQYAENVFSPEQCRKKRLDNLNLMFAGNIGTVQSVDTIIEAARILQTEKDIFWHIVGDGSKFEDAQKLAEGLENVIFHGRFDVEKMPEFFSMSDVMIVTMMNDDVWDKTLPGKVQAYMAAGKPIIGAASGETCAVINDAKCGLCGAAEDAKTLSDNVLKIKEMDLALLGNNAKAYYEQQFGKENFFNQFENVLKANCEESLCTQ